MRSGLGKKVPHHPGQIPFRDLPVSLTHLVEDKPLGVIWFMADLVTRGLADLPPLVLEFEKNEPAETIS